MSRRALAVLLAVLLAGGAAGGASAAGVPALPRYGAPGDSGTVATRSDLAQHRLVDRSGRPVDGRGVTIAVIDTGVDPAHPALRLPDGSSKVVRNLTSVPCQADTVTGADPGCLRDLPAAVDSDTGQGGHGTFIAGVAVGDPLTLTDGTRVGGQAPGARLLMITATTTLDGVDSAFLWVLAHHAAPCGPGVPASVCPPIRALSLSWGFTTTDTVIRRAEDQLARAGVVVCWANGNTGGDGSTNSSNPGASLDPTPGVLKVASYDDLGHGSRDGRVSASSSRGAARQPLTWPALSAPGENIVSSCRLYFAVCTAIGTQPRNGPAATDVGTYNEASGTSFAAPAVAAVAALLFQLRPWATAAQVDDVLRATAHRYRDGAPYRRDGRYLSSFDKGAGLVDAYAAALRFGARLSEAAARP